MQPMIFGWDAFFVPQFNYGVEQFFLDVSHDSHVVVVTKTAEFHDKVFDNLEGLNLSPRRLKVQQGSRGVCRLPVDPGSV